MNISWDEFRFAHPALLLLLLLLPLLWWILGKQKGGAVLVFPSLGDFGDLGSAKGSRRKWPWPLLWLLGLTCLAVALARPQTGKTETQIKASGVDIMLVLDVSGSMRERDFTIGGRVATRVDAVRAVTSRFISARPNDRMGIIAFAGKPYLVSPLTLDHNWLQEKLNLVQIGLVIDGTAIGSAIAIAADRLKDRESKSRIVVLLTDGTNTAGRITPVTAAEAAAALDPPIKIYTIGAGSSRSTGRFGATRMPVNFDEETLQEIASITNGQYFRATDTESLASIYEQIDKMEKTDEEVTQFTDYTEYFLPPLILGAVLIFLAFLFDLTLFRKAP